MKSNATGRVSRPLVRAALHKGLRDAVLDYERWTKGEALTQWGAEAVLSTYCARALTNAIREADAGASLTLEQHFGEVLKWSARHGRRGRRFKAETEMMARPSRRVDMLLWNKGNTPRAVIEIKRIAGVKGLAVDAKRLCDFVRYAGRAYGGSIRFGMLAVVSRMSPKASAAEQKAYYAKRYLALQETAGEANMTVQMSKPKRVPAKNLAVPCIMETVVFTFRAPRRD